MSLIRALESGSIINCCRPGRLHFSIWGLGLCALFLLTSCNSKKYLSENQSFLRDNKIKIKSDDKVDDASDLKEKLTTKYLQRHTRTVAGIPRHFFYYQYQERLRRDSINLKITRRKWSEERLIKNRPVIYDSLKAERTSENFVNYLISRGYRSATSTFTAKTADKETTVYYRVDPGPRMYIDTFTIATTDTSIQRILDRKMDETYLPDGSPLDIELYDKEKTRLVNDFQNEGYARFDETYIDHLEVDTAGGYVKATMRILNENDSILHKQYYVGKVTIYPDYNLTANSVLYDTLIRDVHYITPEPEQTLKPEAIERNLFLHQGDLTRKENLSQTLRNLSRMELVKFVTPASEVDTFQLDSFELDTPFIDYTLYLTRSKKISLSAAAELTYANISGTKSLFGTALSGNYRDLNLFKGAEILSVNLETGVEFNFFNQDPAKKIDLINTVNLGVGTNLSFPRFLDPLNLYHIIGYTRSEDQPALLGNRLRSWLLYDATTRLNLSANYIDIQELYRYYSVTAGLSYDIVPDAFRTLTIDRFGFDLFVPTPADSFRINVLSKSKFQQESFGKYLFTGLLFKKYFFDLKAPARRKAGYFVLNHGVEISGLEVLAVNLAYNAITNDTTVFALGKKGTVDGISNQIRFSHFIKGEADLRFYYDFTSRIQLALRINPGLASPFGGNRFSQQVPYIKQFFVGGPSSNRAWQIRQLGPGEYHDLNADTTIFSYYQTGDIKLDMSAELRFPLFWYFDGAVFIDAANVWALKKDPARPGSNFESKDFLQELGIGYGFGVRLDLDFFIIRLDLGYKWKSPYVLDETGSRYYKFRFPANPEAQIAVGLPF